MKSTAPTVSHFLTLLLIAFCTTTGHSQETLKSIIAKSNFIFSGTIVKMNASNIEIKTVGPTAIVKVDEVIDAVSPFEEEQGKEITVLLSSDRNMKEGSQKIFYTVGWYYGKTLGVKEVPNSLQTKMQDTLKRAVARQRQQIHIDSLRDELSKADLVIQGTVLEDNIKVETNPNIQSEHDPEFRKAVISVQSVLKGTTKNKQITVYYAESDDVLWYRSPKLEKGQQAIFLLHTKQAPALYHINGYTLLDKRDVQPTNSLNDIKALLKR